MGLWIHLLACGFVDSFTSLHLHMWMAMEVLVFLFQSWLGGGGGGGGDDVMASGNDVVGTLIMCGWNLLLGLGCHPQLP